MSVAVRSHMNDFGRISVCGAISLYNDTTPTLVPCVEPAMVFKQLKMEGFLIHRWTGRFQEGMSQMLTWIKEVSVFIRLLEIMTMSSIFSFLDNAIAQYIFDEYLNNATLFLFLF